MACKVLGVSGTGFGHKSLNPARDLTLKDALMDFVLDQLAKGRRFRVLKELMVKRGKSRSITCDNGTEFTSKAMFFWSSDNLIRLQFIQPGKPAQNAFEESFNGKFRDSCLNQYGFRSLEEARQVIDEWREDYNEIRPHSPLGYQPPSVFARAVA